LLPLLFLHPKVLILPALNVLLESLLPAEEFVALFLESLCGQGGCVGLR